MSTLRSALRNHLHFIVVVGILLMVMTWPTLVYVFEVETFWLPVKGRDVWIEIWDAWHGRSFLEGETSLNYTDMLFYPNGMSLDFHPYNMVHMILLAMLQSVLETSNAFNFIYLLIILSSTVAAYVYLIYLFDDRNLALFGAVVFGFSQHIVGHPNHPALNLLFTLPLSLYALHRGTKEQKWRWLLVCGALAGFTGFIGTYPFVCLVLTLGLFIIGFTYSAWRQPRFWLGLVLLFSTAGSISLLRLYPMVVDASGFSEALGKNLGQERHNDLLFYFVNDGHPLLTPLFAAAFNADLGGQEDIRDWHQSSYLGYLPLLLIALGIASRKQRRKMIPWLIILIPFLLLRLGSNLQVNGEVYSGILLPKHYLNSIFPAMFQAVYETDHFQIGVILPLSVLSCYGLGVLLQSVSRRQACAIAAIAAALVAFEYYQVPRGLVVSDQELAHNSWLKNEPDQEEIRLINLPMGRRNAKLYGFYQTINGYPHAEGVAMRTPSESYDYILQNSVLATWLEHLNVECNPDNFDSYLSSADQLLRDGFSHVILHHREKGAENLVDSFTGITHVYRDDYVTIYRVRELRETCANRIKRYQSQFPHLNDFAHSQQNVSRQDVTLLNLYPVEYDGNDARQYFSSMFEHWGDLIHVAYDKQGGATVYNVQFGNTDLSSIIAENKIVWLIYDPQQTDLAENPVYKDWLLRHFKSCELVYQSEESRVEAYVDRRFPCELVVAENSVEVIYQNEIYLTNHTVQIDTGRFSTYLHWSHPSISGYAYTIQVFNEQGEKQLQIDQVIDSRPLSNAQIDTSSLEPGDYVAKLIVYDTESGESQSGTILSTQQTVERELEIAEFTVDS